MQRMDYKHLNDFTHFSGRSIKWLSNLLRN